MERFIAAGRVFVIMGMCIGLFLLFLAAFFWIGSKIAVRLYPGSMSDFWELQIALFVVAGLGAFANWRSFWGALLCGLVLAGFVAVVNGLAWLTAAFAVPCHRAMLFCLDTTGGLYHWLGLSALVGMMAGISVRTTPDCFKERR